MANITFLGIVTLYNPDKATALDNISRYLPCLEELIVWDNSEDCHAEWFSDRKITYNWTGENRCIAPALNYARRHAEETGHHYILLMDEDSKWHDYRGFRQQIEHIAPTLPDTTSFTPYIEGCDEFQATAPLHPRRLFINSGTVLSVKALCAIGEIDERAFPIDALDHHIAMSFIEHGFNTLCLTDHRLQHSLGQPQRLGPFNLYTNNYGAFRTYHMTRSHIICYRMHRKVMTADERLYLWREIIFWKLIRILLAEPEKLTRLKAFVRGILNGIAYKITDTCPHPKQ